MEQLQRVMEAGGAPATNFIFPQWHSTLNISIFYKPGYMPDNSLAGKMHTQRAFSSVTGVCYVAAHKPFSVSAVAFANVIADF